MRVRTSSSRAWLSLTPEPERELPAAIAVLRGAGEARADAGGADAGPDVEREIARAEALVLRGSEPSYLAWLREAAELAARADGDDDPAVAHAAAVVRDVVRNQAGLLLGLPGGGHRRAAAQRALEAVGGNP